jgi:hypothetical protein
MAAASNIGRADKAEHGRVIAHGPRAKAFAQIGIQINPA